MASNVPSGVMRGPRKAAVVATSVRSLCPVSGAQLDLQSAHYDDFAALEELDASE
jgi:hypothetical protein